MLLLILYAYASAHACDYECGLIVVTTMITFLIVIKKVIIKMIPGQSDRKQCHEANCSNNSSHNIFQASYQINIFQRSLVLLTMTVEVRPEPRVF